MTETPLPPPTGVVAERLGFVPIRTRILLLLALTAAACTVCLLVIQADWQRQVNLLLHERVQETTRVLNRVLILRANGARLHADDYTRWDEFVSFTHNPRLGQHWATVNITQCVGNFDVDVAWVLDERFQQIFTTNPKHIPGLARLPVPAPALAAALRSKPVRHFFVRAQSGLLEVWTSPIQGSEDMDRTTPIHGYYLVGRVWTAARMADLSQDADAPARLVSSEVLQPIPRVSGHTAVSIGVRLPALDGSALAVLLFNTTHPMVSSFHETLRMSVIVMIAGVVFLTLAVGAALTRWVGHPLADITEALSRQQPWLLARTAPRRDEFGRVARLVQEFFVQRNVLLAAREAATTATASKSRFLANISHELRTPMHGILSFSRFGLKEAMTAEREVLLDDFKNIESCGSSLLSLLDDLLDLAKLEAARMRFEFAPTPLDEIVHEALDEFSSTYQEKMLRVDVRADGALAPAVVDHRKLVQVMRNLLSNAGKFTPTGGSVCIRIATSARYARVAVEDSGAGIPEGEAALIFESFEQASSAKAQFGGTGLGLAICREIVEAHGGRIWAENREEGGAAIIFEIPLEGPPVSDAQVRLAEASRDPLGNPVRHPAATPDSQGRTAA